MWQPKDPIELITRSRQKENPSARPKYTIVNIMTSNPTLNRNRRGHRSNKRLVPTHSILSRYAQLAGVYYIRFHS